MSLLGKEIVGTFALLIMHNLGHLGQMSAILEDIVVAPHLQRRGIGRKMISWAMDICKAKKCYKVTLSANAKRTNAHAFCQALGFSAHGVSFICET